MADPLYNFSDDNTFGLEGVGATGGFGFGQGKAIVRDTGIHMSGPPLDITGAAGGVNLTQGQAIVRDTGVPDSFNVDLAPVTDNFGVEQGQVVTLPTKYLPPQVLPTINQGTEDLMDNYGGNYVDEQTNFDDLQNQAFTDDNAYNVDYDLQNQVVNDPYSPDIFSNQPLSVPFTEDVYSGVTSTDALGGYEDLGTPVSYDVPTTFNEIPYTPEVTTPVTYTEPVLPTTKIVSTNTVPLAPTEVFSEPIPSVTLQPEIIVPPTPVTQVYEEPLVTSAPIVTPPPPVVTTTTTTAPIVTTTPVVSTTQVIPTPAPVVVQKKQILTVPTTTSVITAPRPTTVVAAPRPVQVVRPATTTVKSVVVPPASPVVQTVLPRPVATAVMPPRPVAAATIRPVVAPRPVVGAPVVAPRPVVGAPMLPPRPLVGNPYLGRPSMPALYGRGAYRYGLGLNSYRPGLATYRPGLNSLRPGLATYRPGLNTIRPGFYRASPYVGLRPTLI